MTASYDLRPALHNMIYAIRSGYRSFCILNIIFVKCLKYKVKGAKTELLKVMRVCYADKYPCMSARQTAGSSVSLYDFNFMFLTDGE